MEARHVAERLSVAEDDVRAATRAFDPPYSAGDEGSPKSAACPELPESSFFDTHLAPLQREEVLAHQIGRRFFKLGGGPDREVAWPSVLQRHWSLSKQQPWGSHTVKTEHSPSKEIEPTNLCSIPNGVSLLAPVNKKP
eukprot:6463275-Amphidinium_carterae.2